MATVFAPPVEAREPGFSKFFTASGFDSKAYEEACNEFEKELRAWCKANTKNKGHDLVGEVIGFQVADGYANYMILNVEPAHVIHMPIYDAWSVPDYIISGMGEAQFRQMVDQRRKLEELFGRSSN